MHTSETSRCGHSSGAEYVRHYKALGYHGLFVTDHFLNGYTTVPEHLPWAERISLFCAGYEAAAEVGARVELDVFFGWEYSLDWAHFLTYGLGKDWLLAHPAESRIMGAAARRLVLQEHTLEVQACRFAELYWSAIAAGTAQHVSQRVLGK